MVTSIARQSVIIKCNMQKSILTGNYEYYYAAGLFSKLTQVTVKDDIKPLELFELLDNSIQDAAAKDERENYLFELLANFRPGEEYDSQMQELLRWGKEETQLWTVLVSS